MEEDKLREIAKQEMTNAIMNNIDSTLIFTYIKNLEDMNEILEQENQSYKDYYGTPPCYDNAKYILKSKAKERIDSKFKEAKGLYERGVQPQAQFTMKLLRNLEKELLED